MLTGRQWSRGYFSLIQKTWSHTVSEQSSLQGLRFLNLTSFLPPLHFFFCQAATECDFLVKEEGMGHGEGLILECRQPLGPPGSCSGLTHLSSLRPSCFVTSCSNICKAAAAGTLPLLIGQDLTLLWPHPAKASLLALGWGGAETLGPLPQAASSDAGFRNICPGSLSFASGKFLCGPCMFRSASHSSTYLEPLES